MRRSACGPVFRGRAVVPGSAAARAVVVRAPFDALASFMTSLVSGMDPVVSSDTGNPEILGETLTGRVLCMPAAVGSTSAGPTWDLLASRGLGPAAVLCAGPIDSLTAGGVIVGSLWDGSTAPVVDRLGGEFLAAVHSGMLVEVAVDGSVRLDNVDRCPPDGRIHPYG